MTNNTIEDKDDRFVRIQKLRIKERRQGLRPTCISCVSEFGLEKAYDVICNNCWGELMEGWEKEE